MADKRHIGIKERTKLFFILLLAVLVVVAGRLIWIQVIQRDFYQSRALEQRLSSLQLESNRGTIYDRSGTELALNNQKHTVVAMPRQITNPAQKSDVLAGILSIDRNLIESRLTRDAVVVYLDRKVEEEVYEELRELDLKGISFVPETERYYPRGSLASQVLGFAGMDNYGLEGLELSFNNELEGIPGLIQEERDAVGRSIPDGVRDYIAPEEGHDIYLTLDETIQYYAERELKQAMEDHTISGGSLIVMEANTGRILALANQPDFNPNNFSSYDSSYWRNKAVQDSFEPGSIYKIFTAALALEHGYFDMNDIFSDPGHIEVGRERIHSWTREGHGWQNFAEIFKNSSNPGFVQVGLTLEPKEMLEGAYRFNFGRKTGIEFPGESPGQVAPGQFTDIEQATMSFGHGLTTTPLQLAVGASAVANGGYVQKPLLVDRVVNAKGEVVSQNHPERIRQAISSTTAEKMRELMIAAVESGTGTAARIEGHVIGGKTGTARHYGNQDIYDTSFVGLIPGDDPELVVVSVLYGLEDSVYYASQNVVPLFHRFASSLIQYLDITPREEGFVDPELDLEFELDFQQEIEIRNYRNQNANQVASSLRSEGLNVKLIGEGETVRAQIPLPRTVIPEEATVRLYTDDSYQGKKAMIPDLRGMSPHEAEQKAWLSGFRLNGIVSGSLTRQSPAPGKRADLFSSIEVE